MIGSKNHDDAICFGKLVSAQNNPAGPVALRNVVTGPTGFSSWYLIQLLLQPSRHAGIYSPQK